MAKTPDDKKKRSSSDTARRIWLAGVGAYGRAFTEAQEAIKDVSGKSSEVFDDLVQKGEMIEMAVGAKRKDLMGKANLSNLNVPDLKMPDLNMPNLNMPNLNMEERIKKMRARLMRMESGDDIETEIEAGMEARLSAIEAKLDLVLAALDTKKPAAKKPAAKKPAAKKVTAKKTTAKKPVKRATTQRTKPKAKPKPKS